MVIFGFNTDVNVGEHVYHVQSEARKADLLLQTMIFVQGQCLGKLQSSYAEQVGNASFSEEHVHELLKNQHRRIMDKLKQGGLSDVLNEGKEVRNAEGESLGMDWTNAGEPPSSGKLVMRLAISDLGTPVEGAMVGCRLNQPAGVPVHSEARTDKDGRAALQITVDALDHSDRAPVVFVQASHGSRSVTRKYRLRLLS